MRKKNQNNLYRDNRGSALGMVLIIVTFISILAGVLMFVAYSGYQMRMINKKAANNFYSAETVLDEINAGLQIDVSDSMGEAYNEVMVNYALYDSSGQRRQLFADLYLEDLYDILEDTADPGYCDLAKLRSYVTTETRGNGDATRAAFQNGTATYGAIVESDIDNGKCQLVKRDDGVVIKNLRVSYVNREGYISIIRTDIRMAVPDLQFAQETAFPSIHDYCLVADETLKIGSTTSGGSVTVSGGVYSGSMEVGRGSESSFMGGTITFQKPDDASEDDKIVVVSREDVTVEMATIKTDDIEFWGANLILDSADASLSGKTSIKDDTTLEGLNSELVLRGEYSGFGNDVTGAETSSAIVVNGRDSALDFSGLESMNISGRAYVATAYDEERAQSNPEGTDDYEKENEKDILTAEAVAIKSNQLAYLIPGEAIGCEISESGVVGDSVYGSNPLKLEEYEELMSDPTKYLLVDGNRSISSLGNRSLDYYMDQEEIMYDTGFVTGFAPEIVFKHSQAGTLVYFYMRFRDENAANSYFADYYGVNQSQVDKYAKLYVDEISMGDTSSMAYLYLGGNMLTYEGGGSGSLISATDTYAEVQRADVVAVTKSDIYRALSAKMVENVAQLTSQELTRTAFNNIISEEKLEDVIHELGGVGANSVQIDANVGGDTMTAVLTLGDYTIDGSTPDSIKMVISNGTVRVSSSFNGLILAQEDIIVGSGGNIAIDALTIDEFTQILLAEKEASDGTEYYVFNVFNDGKNYTSVNSDLATDSDNAIAMSELIVYERWSKK